MEAVAQGAARGFGGMAGLPNRPAHVLKAGTARPAQSAKEICITLKLQSWL